MPFPNLVAVQPAIGTPGDWADSNPRSFVDAGGGGLVAGPSGTTVARAVWLSYFTADADGSPAAVNNYGFGGAPAGIVHRAQQALITAYLAESSMVIPAGFPLAVTNGGGLFVKNEGSTQALPGQYAYASYTNGAFSFAAAGSAATASATASSVAASTISGFTGSITGNVLTITAAGTGTIVAGATITGTSVASNTAIVSQLTGTAGGVGTYSVSIPEQVVASTTIAGTYGTLTLGTVTGTFIAGGVISGSGVVAGTQVTQLLTGTGGTGSTFAVNNNTVVSSTTITEALNVQTGWVAASAGLAGETVKIIGTSY